MPTPRRRRQHASSWSPKSSRLSFDRSFLRPGAQGSPPMAGFERRANHLVRTHARSGLSVDMRLKTWLVAALGLGSLVILIAVSMLASSRRAQNIYAQLDQLNTHHRNVDSKLRALRSDVHLSSIFVRDYLLDVARERAPEYRDQLAEFRRTSVTTLEELRPLVGRDDQISSLQTKLAEYWETFDPLFDWKI